MGSCSEEEPGIRDATSRNSIGCEKTSDSILVSAFPYPFAAYLSCASWVVSDCHTRNGYCSSSSLLPHYVTCISIVGFAGCPVPTAQSSYQNTKIVVDVSKTRIHNANGYHGRKAGVVGASHIAGWGHHYLLRPSTRMTNDRLGIIFCHDLTMT